MRCVSWVALCSLVWPVSAGEFQIGHYGTSVEGVSWEILFDEKARFLFRREGTDVVEGTYRLEEDRIELGNESGTLACDDAHGAGLYRWSWVGQGMFFERLVDTCPGRASALTGGHWRPDPGGLSAGLTRFGLAYDEASSSSSNRCVTCNLALHCPTPVHWRALATSSGWRARPRRSASIRFSSMITSPTIPSGWGTALRV